MSLRPQEPHARGTAGFLPEGRVPLFPRERDRSWLLLEPTTAPQKESAFRGNALFGARTIFCWRALYFLQEIERCADALIDRAAFIFSEQHILSVYSTSV